MATYWTSDFRLNWKQDDVVKFARALASYLVEIQIIIKKVIIWGLRSA